MKSFRTSAVLGALAVVALSSGAAFAGTVPASAPASAVDNAVALDAVAIDIKHIRPLLIKKRIEIHRNQVVLSRLVSVDPVCSHYARL